MNTHIHAVKHPRRAPMSTDIRPPSAGPTLGRDLSREKRPPLGRDDVYAGRSTRVGRNDCPVRLRRIVLTANARVVGRRPPTRRRPQRPWMAVQKARATVSRALPPTLPPQHHRVHPESPGCLSFPIRQMQTDYGSEFSVPFRLAVQEAGV